MSCFMIETLVPKTTSGFRAPEKKFMRELDRFIAASDTRIQTRSDLENAQTQVEREAANKQRAMASMAHSFAAAVEPDLLALLSPRYERANTGVRGILYLP